MKNSSQIIKFIFPLILFLLIPTSTFTEPAEDLYFVLHVRGEVWVEGHDRPLKLKDEVRLRPDAKVKVTFSSPEAAAVLIGRKCQRHVLSPEKLEGNKRSELTDFLRTCFLPAHKTISTRRMNQNQVREEVGFLISLLGKYRKKDSEIAKECFGFLMDVYFQEGDEDKVKEILEKDFNLTVP